MDGEKLERVFQKIKAGKASAAAVHSTGIGTDGAPYFPLIKSLLGEFMHDKHQKAHSPCCYKMRPAANGLRENEEGELLEEEHDKSQGPSSAKRARHEEWASTR